MPTCDHLELVNSVVPRAPSCLEWNRTMSPVRTRCEMERMGVPRCSMKPSSGLRDSCARTSSAPACTGGSAREPSHSLHVSLSLRSGGLGELFLRLRFLPSAFRDRFEPRLTAGTSMSCAAPSCSEDRGTMKLAKYLSLPDFALRAYTLPVSEVKSVRALSTRNVMGRWKSAERSLGCGSDARALPRSGFVGSETRNVALAKDHEGEDDASAVRGMNA